MVAGLAEGDESFIPIALWHSNQEQKQQLLWHELQ